MLTALPALFFLIGELVSPDKTDDLRYHQMIRAPAAVIFDSGRRRPALSSGGEGGGDA